MDIKISKIDGAFIIEINEKVIENVSGYEFSASSTGKAELIIKIDLSNNVSVFESSTSLKEHS